MRQRSLVEVGFRDRERTRRVYEALAGAPLEVVRADDGEEEGYICSVERVSLFLKPVPPKQSLIPKHLAVPIRRLTRLVHRLHGIGEEALLQRDGTLRDPSGHVLTVTVSVHPFLCRDVRRTERFYELLNLWRIPSGGTPFATLLLDEGMAAFQKGEPPQDEELRVCVVGPMVSAIDRLNRAGFGYFDLDAAEIRDPDGRRVVFVREEPPRSSQ